MGFQSNEYGAGAVPSTLATGVPAHTHVDTDITNIGATGQPILEAGNSNTVLTTIGAPSSTGITAIVSISQAAYSALGTKDPATLYVISS